MQPKKWLKSKKFWILIGVILMTGLVGAVIESSDSSKKSEVNQKVRISPTETPVLVGKSAIEVSSEIVKKVDGKYRYFFSVKNADTKDFAGIVHITGKTSSGTMVISQDVDFTKQPLKAGLAVSIYVDANSAPKDIAGDYGVATFVFTAKLNGQEVAQGEGMISSKFESL